VVCERLKDIELFDHAGELYENIGNYEVNFITIFINQLIFVIGSCVNLCSRKFI
jgi:hypothetical protein